MMDEFSRLCLCRLRDMAGEIGKSRKTADWGARMLDAISSLERQAEAGGINADALMDVYCLVFHLAESLNPNAMATERAAKAARARHFGHDILRMFTESEYRKREWKSKKDASRHIAAEINVFARTRGIPPLSEMQKEATVYKWILSICLRAEA